MHLILEGKLHQTSLTLQQNATFPSNLQFHEKFLRVPSLLTAYLQQHLRAGQHNGEGGSKANRYDRNGFGMKDKDQGTRARSPAQGPGPGPGPAPCKDRWF